LLYKKINKHNQSILTLSFRSKSCAFHVSSLLWNKNTPTCYNQKTFYYSWNHCNLLLYGTLYTFYDSSAKIWRKWLIR